MIFARLLSLLAAGAIVAPFAGAQYFSFTDLGIGPGYDSSESVKINASGQIAGILYDWSGFGRGSFIWLPAPAYGMEAGLHRINNYEAQTSSLNAFGQVVGWQYIGYQAPTLWLPEAAYGMQAGMHQIPLPAGYAPNTDARALFINSSGMVVGGAYPSWTVPEMAMVWMPGSINGEPTPFVDIPTPSPAMTSWAKDLNEAGQVVGGYTEPDWNTYGFVWDPVGFTLPLDPTFSTNSIANAINDNWQVTGEIFDPSYTYHDACFWSLATGLINIFAGSGLPYAQSFGTDINDAGQVVGMAFTAGSETCVWKWDAVGGMQEILRIPRYCYEVVRPRINNLGQIIVTLYDYDTSVQVGYYGTFASGALTPVPSLGGTYAGIRDINDSGQMAGWSSFPGDTYCHALLATVQVPTERTVLAVANVNGYLGKTAKLFATLWSKTTKVAGKPLEFFVDGVPVGNATTGPTGVAAVSLPLSASMTPGTHTIKVEFDGDGTYLPSSRTATLTVQKSPTVLAVANVSTKPGSTVALYATLWSGSSKLANRLLVFYVDGKMVDFAKTSLTGTAKAYCKVPAEMKAGPYEIKVVFDGSSDSVYNSSEKTATLTVN